MSYKVAAGDTLGKIAQKFGTTYQEIAKINGISNPNLIQVGQVLKIPGSGSSNNSSTKNNIDFKGNILSQIIPKNNTSLQKNAKTNGISNSNPNQLGQIIKMVAPNSLKTSSPSPAPAPSPSLPFIPYKVASGNTLSNKGTKIFDILKNSPWSSKASALSKAYDVILENGYSVECAIGLMANLAAEGNYGIVEYAFSKNHCYNFHLPSGGYKCKTIKDIEYVKNWTTSDVGSQKWKKGSCGFGSVQWSYGRRVSFANICLSIMKKDSDVNDANWALAEATFIIQELKNQYYNNIKTAATNAGGSVEDWAEAFTDKYEMPQGSDRNMSGTGAACKTRRKYARDIYNHLKNNHAFDK